MKGPGSAAVREWIREAGAEALLKNYLRPVWANYAD